MVVVVEVIDNNNVMQLHSFHRNIPNFGTYTLFGSEEGKRNDSHTRLIVSYNQNNRSASMQQQQYQMMMGMENIDKNEYLPGGDGNPQAAAANANHNHQQQQNSNWIVSDLRPVPAFYPLEKSSRLVEDDAPENIASRLSECLRKLSIAATYQHDSATLHSCENVEMHLGLWKTPAHVPQRGIVVELQRRTGDSMVFHKYARTILDCAVGLVPPEDIQPLTMQDSVVYSKKVQRLMKIHNTIAEDGEAAGGGAAAEEHETAITAIEIAHSLLTKDRMDARILGLESLCLLTDPRKTGYITAVLTSHVVLLGSTQGIEIPGSAKTIALDDEGPFQEIRDGILNLVQFSRIHNHNNNNSNNGDDDDNINLEEDELDADEQQMTLLHNLALAVLANALDVIENPDRFQPEDTKPRARLRTASSSEVANEFLTKIHSNEPNSIDDDAETSTFPRRTEILRTLIDELGNASQKPHDATLSAKCIGSLCRASDEAKKRAKELGAKQVVSTALDVGVRTHYKLETECRNVVGVLERTPSQDQQERQQQQLQVEMEEAEEEILSSQQQQPPSNNPNNNLDDSSNSFDRFDAF
jgi:hypothetical protein